jgi:hypothetical protein
MADTYSVRSHGDDIDFGALTGLAGHWLGANGVNLIAVPDQKQSFEVLIAPYTESLTITKIPATTPNRGLTARESIPTLQYATKISDANTGALMHVECGFWEKPDPTMNSGFDVFRIASVPHGNAVEAMGITTVSAGPPVIDTSVTAFPTAVPARMLPLGYTDRYLLPSPVPGFSAKFPNQYLVDHLEQQAQNGLTVTETVTIQVSTQNQGSISNIISLETNANPTEFDATFWLETLEDEQGHVYRQLQYSQRVMLQFPVGLPGKVEMFNWPHINVNTLQMIT